MPRIDKAAYESAEASAGGGDFKQFTPGAYVVRVQKVLTEWEGYGGRAETADEKQYVKVVYDIDEGPLACMYSEDPFWEGRDYAHEAYLSWKNLGYLKSIANAFEASNPGFDFMAAFEADRWILFTGMRVGMVIDGKHRVTDSGYDRFSAERAVTYTDVESIHAGRHRKPRVVTGDGSKVDYDEWLAGRDAGAERAAAGGGSAYSGDDVPF